MSLGANSPLDGFKPKQSSTAASLLMVQPRQEHKKEVCIQIRINEDKRQLFKEICSASGYEMSDILRAYIDTVIAQGKI